MAKKSLTQTEYLDEILELIIEENDYDAEDWTRKEVKACLEAASMISIAHATDKNGSPIFGVGKLRLHKKKAARARMGRNPSTGEEIKIKARPAMYVPKLRMSKACKDGCAELVKKKNKKLAQKFKAKKNK